MSLGGVPFPPLELIFIADTRPSGGEGTSSKGYLANILCACFLLATPPHAHMCSCRSATVSKNRYIVLAIMKVVLVCERPAVEPFLPDMVRTTFNGGTTVQALPLR